MIRWRKKKSIAGILAVCILLSFTGCGRVEKGFLAKNRQNTEAETKSEAEKKAEETESEPSETTGKNRILRDKDTLYENQDNTSVVTMYLTVSTGNASEHTDHTWTEVNSYSVYDYEDMGVERYAVNGLLQAGDENGPKEDELGYGQETPNATVTIRGQSSSRGQQKSYKIELKDGKGKWNDQRVINLNKHQSDGTRFTNKLCYDLMTELPDMIALKTQFVHLYVKDDTEGGNGTFTDYGLYTQVEQPNKSCLKRHGLDNNGHLYKVNFFEFDRYEDIIMTKNESGYDEAAFEELLEIKGDDDHSKLINLLDEINDYSIPIEEIIAGKFEENNFFSWMAFHILMGNVDTQSRNVLLYSPLNEDVWYFISWDCDGAFTDSRNLMTEEENRQQGGWENGVSNYWGNVLFQRVLKSDSLREKLDEKIKEYRQLISEDKIREMAESYAEVVKPYLYREPDRLYAPYTESEYEQLCKLLPSETERNYRHYLETLEEPMPFHIGVPRNQGDGLHFSWENSCTFSEETVLYTLELASDYSFTEPIVREENIFTPEYIYDGTLEPGQYFVRIKAVSESGQEQYAFDYYVADGTRKEYGILCFYVMPDGSIQEDSYEE